jgi:hypothetical protein
MTFELKSKYTILQNVSPYRKSRKCLSTTWSCGGDINVPGLTPSTPSNHNNDLFHLLETPVIFITLFLINECLIEINLNT